MTALRTNDRARAALVAEPVATGREAPVLTYGRDHQRVDAGTLAEALRASYRRSVATPPSVEDRQSQRAAVAAAHARLYATLVG